MKFHEPFIETNYLQIREFSKEIKWIIVNNDSLELNISGNGIDQNLMIFNGPKLDENYGKIAVGIQHSEALKQASSFVKTKITLILDPDFVVIDWNLILNICNKKLSENFKVVATPWFVTWFRKKSKSIAPHFVFLHSNMLSENFEWYPINNISSDLLHGGTNINSFRNKSFFINYKNIFIVRLLLKLTWNRLKINTEFDTLGGTYLMGERGEVFFVDSVVTKNQLKGISPHLAFSLGRFIESLVGKKYKYLINSYIIARFELSKNNINIEHYAVDGEIFGVHMRGFGSGKLMSNNKVSRVEFSDHLSRLTNGKIFLKFN